MLHQVGDVQTFCGGKTSFKLYLYSKTYMIREKQSIFGECFSGVQLGHVQLLDYLALTDTESFFFP